MGTCCGKNKYINTDAKEIVYTYENLMNNSKEENISKYQKQEEENKFENEENESESLDLYEDAQSKIDINLTPSNSSNWREDLEDNNNFNQNIQFDFKIISFKLHKASETPNNLNPFYTLSAIYDFTKFFKNISSALNMGFSDITEKCELMRKRFTEYPESTSIQDLCNKEIELNIYKLNGDNNKSLGHYDDEYSNYISGCRTFLRLLWFLEYLIDIFENMIKSEGNEEIKKILGNSYNKVLAPHHGFLVRKAVGVALSFSNAGSVSDIVKLVLGYDDFNDESKTVLKETNCLMKKIWNGGNEFYQENNLLDLQ